MATRVSVEKAFRSVEVDLWGEVYETTDLTRSQEEKLNSASEKIDAAESSDEAVSAWGAYFDILLAPIEETKKKPSTVIKAHFKNDEFGYKRLVGLLGDIAAAEQAEAQKARGELMRRPT